ncbi:integrase core domain-containing protein [Rhodopila sp.]|uniref:integrase core domain-containing protein n=1 Tax=Rhodopila sp. TaxID=2480087 RepID=UPI0038CF85DE
MHNPRAVSLDIAARMVSRQVNATKCKAVGELAPQHQAISSCDLPFAFLVSIHHGGRGDARSRCVSAPKKDPYWFKRFGGRVERVMTDNGSAYQSFAFRHLLTERAIRHKRTRPYTRAPNGKAERFIQTSLRDWTYASAFESSAQRTQAPWPWITACNTSRTHSGINHPTHSIG